MTVMRNSHLVFVFALVGSVVVACGDDGEPSPVDSGGSGSDAGGGSAALYDSCTADTQCMSGMCRSFNMPSPGIQVCTQSCSASMPCPMQGGAAVQCTNASVCRPPMAN